MTARGEPARAGQYVVSLSGGTASAVAADRAIARYGRDAVTLWFADTSWEDEDLHRFMGDCRNKWGGEIIRYCDGRTPLDVAEQQHIIPNQKLAPCTHVLKIEPFRRFIQAHTKPLTVLVGLDWSEMHRHDAPRKRYEAIEGVAVDFPLMWKPLEYRPYFQVVKSWGIEPPRLYGYGFPHNNCGGRCVRQGIGEWLRLRATFPERFAEVRDWEAKQRAAGDARANYAIARDQSGGQVRPVTLAELELRELPAPGTAVQEDMFSCFCATE